MDNSTCIFIASHSESKSSFISGSRIGDIEIDEHGDDGGDGICRLFDDTDAIAEAACASICCFGKSCDGHSK